MVWTVTLRPSVTMELPEQGFFLGCCVKVRKKNLTLSESQISRELAVVGLAADGRVLLVEGLGHQVLLSLLHAGEHERLAGVVTVRANALEKYISSSHSKCS